MYRRQASRNHQLVVPQSLIRKVMAMNHDPQFVAHAGRKRTYDHISLLFVAENATDSRILRHMM
jgi:hypothetical protein